MKIFITKMANLKAHPIKELIKNGEGLHLDFKFEISDAAKIARSLVSFANTDGGKLLVGVKDNGVIAGIRSEEEYYMIENAAGRFCRPEVLFQSKEWNIHGKKVLEIFIPKGKKLPYKAPDKNGKYKAFVRVADENILACGIQIKVWNKIKYHDQINFTNSKPEKILLSLIRKDIPFTVDDFRKEIKISKYNAELLISEFILLKLLKIKQTTKHCLLIPVSIPAPK